MIGSISTRYAATIHENEHGTNRLRRLGVAAQRRRMRELGPDDLYEEKARHLRRLYRQHKPAQHWAKNGKLIIDHAQQTERWRVVKAEYERLFPEGEVPLAYILVDVWTEARKLAGWNYDRTAQCWRKSDQSPVIEDDGSEWAHL